MECRTISSRIMSIRVPAAPKNMTIIQVYAPTTSHTDEEIEEFYKELEAVITQTPNSDIITIQGD